MISELDEVVGSCRVSIRHCARSHRPAATSQVAATPCLSQLPPDGLPSGRAKRYTHPPQRAGRIRWMRRVALRHSSRSLRSHRSSGPWSDTRPEHGQIWPTSFLSYLLTLLPLGRDDLRCRSPSGSGEPSDSHRAHGHARLLMCPGLHVPSDHASVRLSGNLEGLSLPCVPEGLVMLCGFRKAAPSLQTHNELLPWCRSRRLKMTMSAPVAGTSDSAPGCWRRTRTMS